MTKIGGFGYVFRSQHTNVDFWETPEGEQRVELQGHKSRTVKNLYELDGNGNYLVWDLIKELEREIITGVGR